jgi:general secretion pathway protein A
VPTDHRPGQEAAAHDRDQFSEGSADDSRYERFFQMTGSPFAPGANPCFLFTCPSNLEALEAITRAFDQRDALVVVTGPGGSGKTLLCDTALRQLGQRTFVCVISGPLSSSDDLIKRVLDAFGVSSRERGRLDGASGLDLVETLQRFLSSLAVLDARAVIVIEATADLRTETLEPVVHLATAAEPRVLQVVLIGRPELERSFGGLDGARLPHPSIARHVRIERLSPRDVGKYIERRLWIAQGGLDALLDVEGTASERVRFTSGAMKAVSALSGGLPRAINVICDHALDAAARRGRYKIDVGEVVTAAQHLGLPVPLTVRLRRYRPLVAAAALVLLAAGSLLAAGVIDPRFAVEAALPETTRDPQPGSVGLGERVATTEPAVDSQASEVVAPLVEIESFTVVTAPFRTAGGAADAAARASRLGLPTFTRAAAREAHQVVIGPYASRGEARTAQQQLETAQLHGTQIVATPPRAGVAAPGGMGDDE